MMNNDDLLSGVRDLKDAFEGVDSAFKEVASSVKDTNKEFKDLQQVVGKTSDVFGKLVAAGAGLFAAMKSWQKISGVSWHTQRAGTQNYIKQLMTGNVPIIKPGQVGWARVVNHPWTAGIRNQLDPLSKNQRWMRAIDPGFPEFGIKGGWASGFGGKQRFLAREFLGDVLARNKARFLGAQFWAKDMVGSMKEKMGHNYGAMWDVAKANKASIGLGLFGAALTGAVAAATMFMKKMREVSTGMFTSGASLGQAGKLSGLAGALGMSPSELGSRARAFGDLLTGGGVPGGLAASIGIRPYGGLGGDQNFFNKFQKALSFITDPNTSFDRASIMSRQFGMEDLMYLRFASPDMRKQALNATGMGSPEEMRKAADAQIQFNLTLKELTNTLMGLGEKVLPTLNLALKNFGTILTTSLIGGLIGFGIGGPAGALAGLGIGSLAGLGIGAALNNNTKATIDQTLATEKQTAAMNVFFKEGVYGGGNRMRTAIPAAYGYSLMEERAWGLGRALGAFAI